MKVTTKLITTISALALLGGLGALLANAAFAQVSNKSGTPAAPLANLGSSADANQEGHFDGEYGDQTPPDNAGDANQSNAELAEPGSGSVDTDNIQQ